MGFVRTGERVHQDANNSREYRYELKL